MDRGLSLTIIAIVLTASIGISLKFTRLSEDAETVADAFESHDT